MLQNNQNSDYHCFSFDYFTSLYYYILQNTFSFEETIISNLFSSTSDLSILLQESSRSSVSLVAYLNFKTKYKITRYDL